MARQCALVASCADQHDATALHTPEGCVDWYTTNARDEAPLAECLMHARTCRDLTACTHAHADTAATSFCASHPGVLSACEGDRFITCEEDAVESASVSCAALGGTCGERQVGGLVVRGCVAPKLCPEHGTEDRCDGSSVIHCEEGITEVTACAAGWRCAPVSGEDGVAGARCRSSSGRDCSGGAFCEGDVATTCAQTGRFPGAHTADCRAFGLTCGVRQAGPDRRQVSCTTPGRSECALGPATCEGDTLHFCAAGTTAHVSCRDLGFDGCNPAGGGGEALCTRGL